jgi:hypothetical protein
MAFDPENEIWSDIDGTRYTKSVTFDAAPPQVNEYEMTTPDPSSVASESRDGSYDSEEDEGDMSFDHDASFDRDDSFDASLEDLEKTPVVLPEDWRFMSPETANADLVKEEEDPFTSEGSQSLEPRPSSRQMAPTRHSRVESLDSNGERRPLPPLPAIQGLSFAQRAPSPDKLAAAFELGSGGQRHLPAPPGPAPYSKVDISEAGRNSMSLEDRLRLMMIQREEREKESEQKTSKAADTKSNNEESQVDDESKASKNGEEEVVPKAGAPDTFSAPRISRDSILRGLRRGNSSLDDPYEPEPRRGSRDRRYSDYDPDVPIPSLENDNDYYEDDDDDDDDTSSVVIKQEQEDDHSGLYDIPDYYGTVPSKDSSFKSLQEAQNDDDESHYSNQSMEDVFSKSNGSSASEATPVPVDRSEEVTKDKETHDVPTEPHNEQVAAPKMAAMLESLRRPITPENREDMSAPSTPDSVIRHPVDDEISDLEESADESIPDPIATVKAPGAGLKIRPSLTPADIEQMAATRRKVSGQIPPPSPPQVRDEPQVERDDQTEERESSEEDEAEPDNSPKDALQPQPAAASPRKPSFMKLDIPFSIQEDEGLGFGLDKEFDRVIESQKVAFNLALSQLHTSKAPIAQPLESHESQTGSLKHSANHTFAQQRGYLMRHNTKVIVASSRPEEEPVTAPATGEASGEAKGTKSAASPQRKVSQQTWTTVPWNSGARRASIRTPSGAIRKKPIAGPVPPLPGQPSNAQEPPTPVEEIEPAFNTAFEDGEERGRLFVKVVGLKYLDLPLPRGKSNLLTVMIPLGY